MTGVTAGGMQTAAAIRREAAKSFVAHGYEATSLRQVAAAVGIKVGSLYNHINSKEDLLLSVMGGTMDDLLVIMADALDGHTDPLDRLITFVATHIRFHAERAQEVFIGNSELRSLQPDARTALTEKRRGYREELEGLIIAATEAGDAEVLNPRLQAFTVVAIGTHVSTWYRPDGDFTLEEIIDTYSKIIVRGLGVKDADARVDGVRAATR